MIRKCVKNLKEMLEKCLNDDSIDKILKNIPEEFGGALKSCNFSENNRYNLEPKKQKIMKNECTVFQLQHVNGHTLGVLDFELIPNHGEFIGINLKNCPDKGYVSTERDYYIINKDIKAGDTLIVSELTQEEMWKFNRNGENAFYEFDVDFADWNDSRP